MIQEHKDLLLKDLCSRLLYGVKIELTWWVTGEGTYINTTLEPDHIEQLLNDEDNGIEIKPYLFTLSSMTEEQRKELFYLSGIDIIDGKFYTNNEFTLEETLSGINWLLKNHFDINDLIPIGLANNAAGLNLY